jgi:hypothetical protein
MRLIILFLLFNAICFSQNNIISKINFIDGKRMDKKFLSKIILSKEGNELDSLTLEKDILLLNRLNGVSKATYSVTIVENHQYQIDYTITENFSLIPTLNIWTTNKTGAYRVGLYEFNFLGKNITIGGFYQYNEFNSFGFNLAGPTLISPTYGFEVNFQKLSSSEPLYFDEGKAFYQYTNTSFELLGVHRFSHNKLMKLGGSIFNEKYQYQEGATAEGVPQSLNLDKKLFKLQYVYDQLHYDYYLIKGYKSTSFLQYVMTENDFQEKFIIGWNDFIYFRRVGKNGNWASRLRLGLSTNNKSPFSPFSVDNNLNIRGVGNIIDRGTGTFVLNTEFRKTIFEKKWFVLQSNAFVDAGSWRNPGGNFSDFANSKNFRVYPGLGIRFIHKTIFNAIFRLDYGYGITKNASRGIVFGIGQYF